MAVTMAVCLSCKFRNKQVKKIEQQYDKSLSELIEPNTEVELLINKSSYTLSVTVQDTVVKVYPVVFGGNPVDDKLMEGDKCTPEGVFKVKSKYPHKSWSKFIWLDYPNKNSWQKHNKAKADGKIPKRANIGGEIGIHGVPNNASWLIDQRVNWTLGCISLTNESLNELYPFVSAQTIVRIVK